MDNGHKMLDIKYSNTKQLKNLLNIYSKLEAQELRGNSDAIALKVDLDFMLTPNNILNEKKIKLLKLYYIKGYSQQEIAELVGMTQTGVNSNLKSSINALAEYWSKRGD